MEKVSAIVKEICHNFPLASVPNISAGSNYLESLLPHCQEVSESRKGWCKFYFEELPILVIYVYHRCSLVRNAFKRGNFAKKYRKAEQDGVLKRKVDPVFGAMALGREQPPQ